MCPHHSARHLAREDPPALTHATAKMGFTLTVKSVKGEKVDLEIESLEMKVRSM